MMEIARLRPGFFVSSGRFFVFPKNEYSFFLLVKKPSSDRLKVL